MLNVEKNNFPTNDEPEVLAIGCLRLWHLFISRHGQGVSVNTRLCLHCILHVVPTIACCTCCHANKITLKVFFKTKKKTMIFKSSPYTNFKMHLCITQQVTSHLILDELSCKFHRAKNVR